MSRAQVARRLLRLLRPLAPLMAVSAGARVVNQSLGVAIPALAAVLVVGAGTGLGIQTLLALLAGLAVVKGGFRYLEQFTGHAVAFRLLATLRVDTYRSVEPLAPAGLEDERTGDLVARVVGDIDRVEPFYAHTIAPLVSAVTVPLLAAAGLALWVDPVLALVFVPFPLLVALVTPLLRAARVAELARQARERGGETSAMLTDAVQGAREIAVFDAHQTFADNIQRASTASASVRRAMAGIASVRSGLGDLLAGACVVTVAAAAAARMGEGAIDVAGLAAAITVAWVGTAPARALEDIVPSMEEALAAAGRLFDLSDRTPPVISSEGSSRQPSEGSVSFREVTVRPRGSETPSLEGVSVEIPDGSYVGVVGPSGAGKSTLVELLVRFRDPEQGLVEVGGADLRSVDPERLRSDVMLVPQRSEIFYGTLAGNLRLARPDASDKELWEALDRASLGPWARLLGRGLETTIGELGETISGGQRQRLALARAFLRDPRIIILDEATSELDPATEQQVLAEVTGERENRTVIVVAHRLETVVDADQILVLDGGRLVERGRHEELVASGGVYAGLWRRHLDFVA